MTPRRKVYGLLGYPVKHSLSPCMHNAALKALRIKGRYELFELKPQELKNFFLNLQRKNICGFNVTIPYKEKVLSYLDASSGAAKRIGAANAVVVGKAGKLMGFNTDYTGFSRHLRSLKLKPRKVAVIGAGGASRAVCFALGKMHAEEICVCDIDNYRSLALVKQFKDMFAGCRLTAVARVGELKLAEKDLLVNASSVGMKDEHPCLLTPDMLHKDLFVYELIYSPAETKLLAQARQAGLRGANGLGMLFYQGVESFEHFTGRKAPVEAMRKALEKGATKL